MKHQAVILIARLIILVDESSFRTFWLLSPAILASVLVLFI